MKHRSITLNLYFKREKIKLHKISTFHQRLMKTLLFNHSEQRVVRGKLNYLIRMSQDLTSQVKNNHLYKDLHIKEHNKQVYH